MIPLGENESASVDTRRGPVLSRWSGRRTRRATGTFHPPDAPAGADQAVQHGRGAEGGRPGPALADRRPQRRPAVQAAARRGDVGPASWHSGRTIRARSQWISTAGDLPDLPDGVTYTFRTTFELDRTCCRRAAVLRGRFIADNHVDGDPPERPRPCRCPSTRRVTPFDRFTLYGRQGFRRGDQRAGDRRVESAVGGRRSKPHAVARRIGGIFSLRESTAKGGYSRQITRVDRVSRAALPASPAAVRSTELKASVFRVRLTLFFLFGGVR